MSKKFCSKCLKLKKKDSFYKRVGRPRGCSSWCKTCTCLLAKQNVISLRKAIITNYGNQCTCCGEKQEAFLTVDHIHNNGAKHRKQLGTFVKRFYLWLQKRNYPQQDCQLLCRNCNWGKFINNGTCPHQENIA